MIVKMQVGIPVVDEENKVFVLPKEFARGNKSDEDEADDLKESMEKLYISGSSNVVFTQLEKSASEHLRPLYIN